MTQELATIPPKPLTVIERASLVFAGVKSEEELQALAKASETIVTITNDDGLKQCHSARMALKNQRLEIARIGEEGREDAVKTSRAIIERQKALIGILKPEEDRLAAIQEAWEDRVKAEKEAKILAEQQRQQRLRERIDELRGCQVLTPASGSALILEHISDLEAIPVDDSFEEYRQQADDAKTAALARLAALHAAAVAHEAEQARIVAEREELAKLRSEAAERQKAIDAENARKEAEAQAERNRQEAAAKAEREAEAARQAETNRIERERIAEENRVARLHREAEAAKAAEVARLEREDNERRAAEARAKLEADAEVQRKENEAAAAALAAERAELERQREAAKPKPKKGRKVPLTKEAIITAVAEKFSLSESDAIRELSLHNWKEQAAA